MTATSGDRGGEMDEDHHRLHGGGDDGEPGGDLPGPLHRQAQDEGHPAGHVADMDDKLPGDEEDEHEADRLAEELQQHRGGFPGCPPSAL